MKGIWKGENDEVGLLTGKTYEIVSIEFDGKMFSVVDESGGEYLYPAEDFEVVEERFQGYMRTRCYTEKDIIEKCEKAMKNPSTFYQADVVNYRGRTTDTGELYNEIVAKYVCDHFAEFVDGIPTITREETYKTESHTGERIPSDTREEERIAVEMFNQKKFDFIGEIIDYQTPLKNTSEDVAGKIDLLSYDGKTLYILELKKSDSKETMLRCVLEGITYMKTVDTEKLLKDFGLPPETNVVASPLVFLNGEQHKEMMENRPWLKKIMVLMNSKPFYVIEEHKIYSVICGNLFECREFLKDYLVDCGLSEDEAFEVSEKVRKGFFYKKPYINPLIPKEVTDWFREVKYLPSVKRVTTGKRLSKHKFDEIIRQNLIGSGVPEDSFKYKSGDFLYEEYYNKNIFDKFVKEMESGYLNHYKKFCGDSDVSENQGGKGGELTEKKGKYGMLPPKMASVASSSRFCYLALRNGTAVLIPGRTVTKDEVEFEKECRIFLGSSTAPQLDAYIADKECDVFVEAKCHEIFDSHKIKMKKVYWQYFKENNIFSEIVSSSEEPDGDFELPLSAFGIEKENSRFDVKQFICHLLGIANYNKGKYAKLVYLFFKPVVDSKASHQINAVFNELKAEINSLFNCKLIKKFCKKNNIELMAIAEESKFMEDLTSDNMVNLLDY